MWVCVCLWIGVCFYEASPPPPDQIRMYIIYSVLSSVSCPDEWLGCMHEALFTNTWAFLGILIYRCMACGNVLPNFVRNSFPLDPFLFSSFIVLPQLLRAAFFLFTLCYLPPSFVYVGFVFFMPNEFSSGVLMPSFWIGVRKALVFQVFQMQHIQFPRTKWKILIRMAWVWKVCSSSQHYYYFFSRSFIPVAHNTVGRGFREIHG